MGSMQLILHQRQRPNSGARTKLCSDENSPVRTREVAPESGSFSGETVCVARTSQPAQQHPDARFWVTRTAGTCRPRRRAGVDRIKPVSFAKP